MGAEGAETGSAADRPRAGSGPAHAAHADASAILSDALEDVYQVRRIEIADETLEHLDTVDGRLRRAGIDLVFDAKAQRLTAYPRSGPGIEQLTDAMTWPALVSSLSPGPVRDLITAPVSIRALMPVATSATQRIRFDVVNDDQKTVARLRWRQGSLVRPTHEVLPVDLSIDRMRGYSREATSIARLIGTRVPISLDGTAWLAAVSKLAGSHPETGRRFGMHPDLAADLAVADALLGYLDRVESNVDGIIDDIDTEFLHQFRVEVRRSRSVIKLVGDVLPDGIVELAAAELRWLGDATTPTRDLDVYLLEMDDLAVAVEHPDDLTSLSDHIRKHRSAAWATLVDELRSARFASFVRQWRSALTDVVSTPSRSPFGVSELADERIGRTFRKVRKRAESITSDSPGEQIHALRKACKEMRYLMELFRPVCNPSVYKKVVAEFKDLQDVLGDFQDGEVQSAGLRVFARQMLDEGAVDADTILTMGALSAHFDDRQRVARAALTARPGGHVDRRLASHVRRLVAS